MSMTDVRYCLLNDPKGSEFWCTFSDIGGCASLVMDIGCNFSGETETDYQFTPCEKHAWGQAGQRNEEEIGLYYYVARYYDPSLGRFIQADYMVPNAGSVKAYDRYLYSNNNPINYIDPTGHFAWAIALIAGGAIIGAAIDYGSQVYNNYQDNGGDLGAALTTNIDVVSIGKSAFVGAAVGLTVAVAAPAVIGMAGEGLMGVGLLTGSTTVFGAGVTTYGMATTLGNVLFCSSRSLSNVVKNDIRSNAPPNPNGINGKLDHQAGVDSVTQIAKNDFPPDQGNIYRYNVSIRKFNNGIDRRPDLTVWRNGQLQRVYEVARTNQNGSLVTREMAKQLQYIKNGINSFFYKIPR